jgi:dienelactone hydrolase
MEMLQSAGSFPWIDVTHSREMSEPLRLIVQRNGVDVPSIAWLPEEPRGIVLTCHGGGGHKSSPGVLAVARECLARNLAVLSCDGLVHGERRDDGNLEPAAARASFRQAWRQGVGQTSMAEDMAAALDALQRRPDLTALPVGYVGVSMGTAYGLPLLAHDRRIQAAAIGLWATNYAASEHLAAFAADVACAVWFTLQWNDEFFDREGAFALFDAIGAADKRLVAYPGPHRELEGDRLSDAINFVAGRLLGRPTT